MSAVPQMPPEPRSSAATSLDRRIQMLRTAMGPVIAAALEDPDVVEVMLNPDRTLWVDRLSSGRAPLGIELPEADGERIIRLVAAHVGAEVHRGQPLLTAELPETGERFEGILPPAAPGPAFALRKRAVSIIGLDRYVADGILTAGQAEFLRHAVRERHNILIAGGTSTGKTTLANALLAALLLFLAGTAQAAGSSMPWEGPLQSILESIQGPVARIVAVIIIIATGLALAFGDTSGGFRKLIQIVFGLSIAFAASSFFLSFFSFSGGAVV